MSVTGCRVGRSFGLTFLRGLWACSMLTWSKIHLEENEKYNCLSHVSRALLTTGQHFVTRLHCAREKMTRISREFFGDFEWKYCGGEKVAEWGDMYKPFLGGSASFPITSSALFALGHRTCAAFPQQYKTHPEKPETKSDYGYLFDWFLWCHRPISKTPNKW